MGVGNGGYLKGGPNSDYMQVISTSQVPLDPRLPNPNVLTQDARVITHQIKQEITRPTNPRDEDMSKARPAIRTFDSGATRNLDVAKFDFEGFLNPEALHAFGEYMHEHRTQRDGSIRDSDNWQKGIPFSVYIKSLVRHTIDLWRMNRGYLVINPDTGLPQTKKQLCAAITFNAMGYMKELVDPSPINKEK